MDNLETKPAKQTTYCRSKADDFFNNFAAEKVDAYKDYWESVAPQTDGDRFRRYLFAYCSVHTSWQGNCRGYEAIKNYEVAIMTAEERSYNLEHMRTNLGACQAYREKIN